MSSSVASVHSFSPTPLSTPPKPRSRPPNPGDCCPSPRHTRRNGPASGPLAAGLDPGVLSIRNPTPLLLFPSVLPSPLYQYAPTFVHLYTPHINWSLRRSIAGHTGSQDIKPIFMTSPRASMHSLSPASPCFLFPLDLFYAHRRYPFHWTFPMHILGLLSPQDHWPLHPTSGPSRHLIRRLARVPASLPSLFLFFSLCSVDRQKHQPPSQLTGSRDNTARRDKRASRSKTTRLLVQPRWPWPGSIVGVKVICIRHRSD
ncbi:hypothetical protein QBC39DRAFT_145343 [Podospora conica]|nr:hypothetical protein QBC39DRAFT_145343 [Schizothecium conicum]